MLKLAGLPSNIQPGPWISCSRPAPTNKYFDPATPESQRQDHTTSAERFPKLSDQFEIFIEGESIDLCVATEKIAFESDWYKWFNDKTINKNLEQGLFPNTRETQRDFFISETNSGKRLILLIVTKGAELKGVISLSNINFFSRTAEIALVIDGKIDRKESKLAALEAIALITQHGFDTMGLNRISGLQNRALGFWQRHMELIGYRIEGAHRNSSRDSKSFTNNAVTIASTYDDYETIIENRGKLFDSEAAMLDRLNALPDVSVVDGKRSFCC